MMTATSNMANMPTTPLTLPSRPIIAKPIGAEHLFLIVPSDEGELQASAMENFFQACATDEAFCLELTGTRREQGFILRASSAEQVVLLSKQFSAQYPQAELGFAPFSFVHAMTLQATCASTQGKQANLCNCG